MHSTRGRYVATFVAAAAASVLTGGDTGGAWMVLQGLPWPFS